MAGLTPIWLQTPEQIVEWSDQTGTVMGLAVVQAARGTERQVDVKSLWRSSQAQIDRSF